MGKLFGDNVSAYVQYAVAFVTILILLLLLAYILRLVTRRRLGGTVPRGRAPRLGVVEVFDLDNQRRLILLRRDNVEHLVMIGGPTDVVVESAFVRTGSNRVPAPQIDPDRLDEEFQTRPEGIEPPVRPVIGDGPGALPRHTLTPHTLPPAQEPTSRPVTQHPAMTPPPAPSQPAPPIAPAAEPQRPPVMQPTPPRPVAPPAAPQSVPSQPTTMTVVQPKPPASPQQMPIAPPVARPPQPPAPPPAQAAPATPPQPAPPAKSAFASRLEEAMKRPFANRQTESAPLAPIPPSTPPAPATPAPVQQAPIPHPPVQTAPPQRAEPQRPDVRPELHKAAPAPVMPTPASAQSSAPVPASQPAPKPAPSPAATMDAAPAATKPPAADPFDLGALEDEMAKLLGRTPTKK
ncbi:MAG: hypothetical protein ACRCXM_17330 [Beijerinckiaceae bacterium]